jgi:hypothetical protein
MSTSDTGVNPRATLTGRRIECRLVEGRLVRSQASPEKDAVVVIAGRGRRQEEKVDQIDGSAEVEEGAGREVRGGSGATSVGELDRGEEADAAGGGRQRAVGVGARRRRRTRSKGRRRCRREKVEK